MQAFFNTFIYFYESFGQFAYQNLIPLGTWYLDMALCVMKLALNAVVYSVDHLTENFKKPVFWTCVQVM